MNQNYLFKSITLKTSKLPEQFQFFVEKLGFSCISNSPDSFSITCGKTALCFEKFHEDAHYHFAFNIPENQIEKAIEWLKMKTEIIQYEEKDIVDFPNWNAHSLYFKDPAGNILEFIARHNLNNQSTSVFDSNSITEISEIGIPTTDIPDIFEKLNNGLGFELYSGDMEKFAAIGHEKCLFITVPLDRVWFPTDDLISKIWPIDVKLSDGINTKMLKIEENEYVFAK